MRSVIMGGIMRGLLSPPHACVQMKTMSGK